MSRVGTYLKPTNRRMLIVPSFRETGQTETGVLLPEEYRNEESRYIKAIVVDIADDCSEQFRTLRRTSHGESKTIVVESAMIEEVMFDNKKNHIILENYVVGILRESNERF